MACFVEAETSVIRITLENHQEAKRTQKRLLDFRRNLRNLEKKHRMSAITVSCSGVVVILSRRKDPIQDAMRESLTKRKY